MCTLVRVEAQIGDKARLKDPARRGGRAVVVLVQSQRVVVRVDGKDIEAAAEDVTNLSLAARKAWESMPDRRVGRPKGTRLCDRVYVTLRIDRELWQSFRQLEEDGVVSDRTTTINECLRAKVSELRKMVSADRWRSD